MSARLGRQSLLNLVGYGVGGAGQLLVVLLTARALPQADAGRVYALISAALIVAAVLRLGTSASAVLFLAREGEPDEETTRRIARMVLLPVAGASLLVATVGVLVAVAIDSAALAVLALTLPATALVEPLLGISRGTGRMLPTVLADRAGRPLLQVLLLGGAWLAVALAGGSLTVTAVVACWCAPYLVGAGVAWWSTPALHRLHTWRHGWPRPLPGEAREMVRFSASRSATEIMQMAFARLDVVLVAALAGPEQAALYTVVTRFVVVVQLVQQAIATATEPPLAAAVAAGRRADAAELYRTSTAWIVSIVWPLLLLVLAKPDWWLGVFGPAYAGSFAVVLPLGLAMLVASAVGSAESVLTMAGRSDLVVGTNVVALVTMIGVDLALIPAHGATGAAIGWASAIVIKNVAALVLNTRGPAGHPFSGAWLLAVGLPVVLVVALPGLLGALVPAVADAAELLGLAALAVTYVLARRRLRLDRLVAIPARRRRAAAAAASPDVSSSASPAASPAAADPAVTPDPQEAR
ncbi:lipopolysaccharide biosynthesis protein [Nocardioides bruguierae]|uniref:lipopolysaccharide biosynthesis protein n=1 Tax=Nocardioides bruguierae TaxID=2945102 RepID=UPI00201FC99B|nr:oligosaccharide flippase family protein [Nocardioides bruguierae]MCL8027262.1 oligosaccharide flippase family protein [Nocardioides bruguierae]